VGVAVGTGVLVGVVEGRAVGVTVGVGGLPQVTEHAGKTAQAKHTIVTGQNHRTLIVFFFTEHGYGFIRTKQPLDNGIVIDSVNDIER
jgi:hypothetical protein